MTAALLSLLLVVSGGVTAAALDDAGEESSFSTELSVCDDRAPDALAPESRTTGVPHRFPARGSVPAVPTPRSHRPLLPPALPAPPRAEGERNTVLRC
ncbi:hypothetical protein AC230_00910 [Streptomyces caatingaensis]|uniref:Secreted protein n=1 Tax=Streptomyces caatingaensis TaxID=1678637 RepID=A0A0K9XKW7_9ACTN|nr:hypothetical protein AC230_00910 [Streptomyces caatingaensis]